MSISDAVGFQNRRASSDLLKNVFPGGFNLKNSSSKNKDSGFSTGNVHAIPKISPRVAQNILGMNSEMSSGFEKPSFLSWTKGNASDFQLESDVVECDDPFSDVAGPFFNSTFASDTMKKNRSKHIGVLASSGEASISLESKPKPLHLASEKSTRSFPLQNEKIFQEPPLLSSMTKKVIDDELTVSKPTSHHLSGRSSGDYIKTNARSTFTTSDNFESFGVVPSVLSDSFSLVIYNYVDIMSSTRLSCVTEELLNNVHSEIEFSAIVSYIKERILGWKSNSRRKLEFWTFHDPSNSWKPVTREVDWSQAILLSLQYGISLKLMYLVPESDCISFQSMRGSPLTLELNQVLESSKPFSDSMSQLGYPYPHSAGKGTRNVHVSISHQNPFSPTKGSFKTDEIDANANANANDTNHTTFSSSKCLQVCPISVPVLDSVETGDIITGLMPRPLASRIQSHGSAAISSTVSSSSQSGIPLSSSFSRQGSSARGMSNRRHNTSGHNHHHHPTGTGYNRASSSNGNSNSNSNNNSNNINWGFVSPPSIPNASPIVDPTLAVGHLPPASSCTSTSFSPTSGTSMVSSPFSSGSSYSVSRGIGAPSSPCHPSLAPPLVSPNPHLRSQSLSRMLNLPTQPIDPQRQDQWAETLEARLLKTKW